jgi:hypothetical protein
LFLTIEGTEPTELDYIPIKYGAVNQILENLISSREASLGADVLTLIRHYTKLLRRHFMEDSELITLAKRLYEKHGTALDFIFEHRPDIQTEIYDFLMGKFGIEKDLIAEHSPKSYPHFLPATWSKYESLNGQSRDWIPSGRLLLFEFRNEPQRLQLALIIGPGNQEVRQKIFDHAIQTKEIYKPSSKNLYPKWSQIWSKDFLTRKEVEEGNWEFNWEKIEKTWDAFIHNELPMIRDDIQKFMTGAEA